MRRRLKVLLPVLAAVLVVVPVAVLWVLSWVPGSYSVLSMGYPDYGGGSQPAMPSGHSHDVGQGGGHGDGQHRSVADLVADPDRAADVRVDLVAEQRDLDIDGRTVSGYTLNGATPGPTITATVGQLVEVRLHNASVAEGVTLHWHGYDVPAAMDGVAGVTQDAVAVGADFTYRFVADRAGTYWYHSHQVSHVQVIGGLYGLLVVRPTPAHTETVDVAVASHTYGGTRTLNGAAGDLRVAAGPGDAVRVRVVNTDNGPIETWTSAPYRVLAIDGAEVNRPSDVTNRSLTVTGGGRMDLGLTMPADGSPVRIQVSASAAVVLGEGDPPAARQPADSLDLLSYGSATATGLDPSQADRHFDYVVGRRPGFVRGIPGMWWTINGHLFPNVPMYVVDQGDVVVMRIVNSSGELHPMHLHGHHALVLSRNGVAATGSPWWTDSLNVLDGETFEIAFVADNPGIWLDHCHNLQHAAEGMVAHLMYSDVTTPYRIGDRGNEPE